MKHLLHSDTLNHFTVLQTKKRVKDFEEWYISAYIKGIFSVGSRKSTGKNNTKGCLPRNGFSQSETTSRSVPTHKQDNDNNLALNTRSDSTHWIWSCLKERKNAKGDGIYCLTDRFGSGYPVQTDCKLSWQRCPDHKVLWVWEEEVWGPADSASDLCESCKINK